MSDSEVGRECEVGHTLVRQVRETLTGDGKLHGKASFHDPGRQRKYKKNAHLRGGNKTTDGRGNIIDRVPDPGEPVGRATDPPRTGQPAKPQRDDFRSRDRRGTPTTVAKRAAENAPEERPRPISFRPSRVVAEAMRAYRTRCTVPPSQSAVVEHALRMFLRSEGFDLKDITADD